MKNLRLGLTVHKTMVQSLQYLNKQLSVVVICERIDYLYLSHVAAEALIIAERRVRNDASPLAGIVVTGVGAQRGARTTRY